MGEVRDVDPATKRVMLADGGVFPYDYLIVAAGSQTSYYGHDGWQEWAPGLKNIEEATNIRHKILGRVPHFRIVRSERLHTGLKFRWLLHLSEGV